MHAASWLLIAHVEMLSPMHILLPMKHDTLGRRKRHIRTSTKRELIIGPRDVELFRLLQRYRYLRASQIRALLPDELRGKSEKRFRERLGTLYHERYLARPQQQMANLNFYYAESIYALDERGETYLSTYGHDGPFSHLAAKGRAGAHKQFVHSMMVVDTLVSIELAVRAEPGLRYLNWQDVLAKMPPAARNLPNPFLLPRVGVSYTPPGTHKTLRGDIALIPDGVFAIEYPTGFVLYLLEAEHKDCASRTTLKSNSFLRKVLAYRELRRRRLFEPHFGTASVVILTVAPSAVRVESLLNIVNDISRGTGSSVFAFQAIRALDSAPEAAPQYPKLGDPHWKRAGRPPLLIVQPKV